MTGRPPLSIVMPVLDEAAGVEVIVVDGGSSDGTPALAGPLADCVLTAPRGRSLQMNAGAAVAQGEVLLFLHADTQLPVDADVQILDGLKNGDRVWGRFDVRIEGGGLLRAIAMMMNTRSRLTGIATGDQAMFVTARAFVAAGGFPPIALMEDLALSARLKRLGRPLALRARVTASPRRWRKYGTLRTLLLMWRLRLKFFFGADPRHLAEAYDAPPR